MKDDEQREIVYCLRYVLTKGITLADGCEKPSGGFMYDTDWPGGSGDYSEILHSGEWTRNSVEALVLAELMRNKRIGELESLSFDLPKPGATLVARYAHDDLEVPNEN